MALSLVGSTTPVRGASHTSFQSVSTIFLALTRHVAPLPIHQSAVSSVRLATLRASPMTCILGSLPTLWVRMWRTFRLRLWPMGLWKLLLKYILTSSPTNQVSVDMKLVLIVIILLPLYYNMKEKIYSGTPLQWTPLGIKSLSIIARCP